MATTNVTKQKQAKTNTDVNKQDARTRLWQSYKTMGQNQIDESNKRFEEAYVNADLQAQSRGMGRSSFLNQTLANIDKNKAEYAAKIDADTIAQFQQALNNLEQQEQQQANFEAQLNQSKQQWSQQMAMQYLSNILANNGNASDALLEQAGLSRKDFEAMRKQQATGGGGRGRVGGDPNSNPNAPGYTQEQLEILAQMANTPANLNSFETSTTTTNQNNYYDPKRPHYTFR